MKPPKMTAAAVVDALRAMYGITADMLGNEEWALLTEVPLRVSQHPHYRTWFNERRIDVLLVRNWSSGRGFDRLAVEVKVSRSDYRNETDVKREPAWASAQRCAYAAPVGLIDVDSLPDGWGLIEVQPNPDDGPAFCRWRRTATRHEPTADLDYLVAACARIASRHAEHLRRGDSKGAKVANLRRETTSLTGKLERSQEAVYRERGRVAHWRGLALAVEGMQNCADCGHPITPTRNYGWRHRDKVVEEACRDARAEAERVRREKATGSAYIHSPHYAGPVEPVRLRELYAQEDT
jgi:hypothetical protein